MDDPVAVVLRAAIEGDARALASLDVPHPRLREAAASMPPLVLTRHGLTRVLRDLLNRHISVDEAQRWASLMRRGYLQTESVIRPIDIEYEDEDAIVEPLARLDELGDMIDGTMSDEELSDWIVRLSA